MGCLQYKFGVQGWLLLIVGQSSVSCIWSNLCLYSLLLIEDDAYCQTAVCIVPFLLKMIYMVQSLSV